MPGTLFVVATPIGNLDDITLRALQVLRDVALIAAEDTRRTAHLLSRHGIPTPTTSLHEHNEQQKSAALVARLVGGGDIALVSDAGTPTISDPGTRLIRSAVEAGIRIVPIPGPNAAVTALSAYGLLTDRFAFFGFPPTRSKDRKHWFQRVAGMTGVVVFYEAPHRLERTLDELAEHVGDRAAIIARELTKIHEELVRGPISTVAKRLSSTKGEFTVVVDLGSNSETGVIIGQSTDKQSISLRSAVASFADQVGVSANELYRAVDRLKNIGDTTNNK